MKIIDGIKEKGSPFEIPNCGRDDLPEFFKEMDYKVGAEIGTLRGEFTEKFCQAGFKMFAIDVWGNYPEYRRYSYEEPQEVIYQAAKERLAPYDCTLIRKFSMDALKDIPDGSLDFIYIDGSHSFPFVVNDIFWWNKKVRTGGALAGHDYWTSDPARRGPYSIHVCHVKYAVDIIAKIFAVPNFYILGQYRDANRDKWRSWLWLK